ncbi:MAG: O-antigen ligase family protein [Tsuneonella sp.]
MKQMLGQSGLVRSEGGQRIVRRACLLLAALLSGGNLILPRLPLLAALIIVASLIAAPAKLLRPELGKIWLLLVAILMVSIIGSEGLYLSATAVRYANFLAAIILLLIYIDLPRISLIDDLLPILIFFAGQAILTPTVAILAPEAFVTFEVGDVLYYTFAGILTYHETIVSTLKRPDGFFFEPGVLQIYLNLLLFVSLFIYRRPVLIALALVAVLATQSTTGIVIAVLMAAGAAWDYLRTAGINNRLVVLIMAPIVLAPLVLLAQFNLDQKILGEMRGSTIARQYDLQAGLAIVREHPVFGIGFDYERYRDVANEVGNFRTELSVESASERTSSNGLILLMAMLGFPLFLVLMWGLARQRLLPKRGLAFVFLVLSFIGEALILTPFFLMLILSGFVSSRPRTSSHAAHRLRPA